MQKVIFGDNLTVLKDFSDNSIDSIVTDPPYGLGKEPDIVKVMEAWIEKGFCEIKQGGFMGKKWDAFVPQPIFWKEAFRVLKPGGYILCACGTRTQDWMTASLRFAGFKIRDVVTYMYGSGFPKSLNIKKALDKKKNITDEIDQWDGYGTNLKPACEFFTLAQKPISENTIAQNVLKWGVGVINIDSCRIGEAKRFPANIIFDEEATKMLDEQTGLLTSGGYPSAGVKRSYNGIYGKPNKRKEGNIHHNVGGASRFFYCAKASTIERNFGLENFPKKAGGVKNASGRGFSKSDPYAEILAANHHVTIKPVSLMQYLARLITPKMGTVLDPFNGSGTTGIACKIEGFNYIGIEQDEEYCNISKARIKAWKDYLTYDQNMELAKEKRGISHQQDSLFE